VQGNLEVTIYGVLYAFIGAGFYEEFTFRGLICEDERQFVRHTGQEWTTLKRLAANHRNRLQNEAPQLLGIGTEPEFAIGQRALLLQSPGGNLLWDCISLLNDETIAELKARGGIRAIAISHPHFYSSMIEWAECFDAQIFCIRPIANGSCARIRAFNSGKDQPCHFGMGQR
jgi:hypothetical protein